MCTLLFLYLSLTAPSLVCDSDSLYYFTSDSDTYKARAASTFHPFTHISQLFVEILLPDTMMMRLSLLAGALAALSHTAHGLVFNDKIKQAIDENTLTLLHDVSDETSVGFGIPTDPDTEAWRFNTTGYPDDEAVITAGESNRTLLCSEGRTCKLDPEATQVTYRVVRKDENSPFTFQEVASGLYVSRTPDLALELTPSLSDSNYFILEGIHCKCLVFVLNAAHILIRALL